MTLDLKKRNYNLDPSVGEARLLEWLLADHDAQVRRFAAASLALKEADGAAHATLFAYIGAIDRAGARADGAPDAGPDAGPGDGSGGEPGGGRRPH